MPWPNEIVASELPLQAETGGTMPGFSPGYSISVGSPNP
jgi:hypothetical protein